MPVDHEPEVGGCGVQACDGLEALVVYAGDVRNNVVRVHRPYLVGGHVATNCVSARRRVVLLGRDLDAAMRPVERGEAVDPLFLTVKLPAGTRKGSRKQSRSRAHSVVA